MSSATTCPQLCLLWPNRWSMGDRIVGYGAPGWWSMLDKQGCVGNYQRNCSRCVYGFGYHPPSKQMIQKKKKGWRVTPTLCCVDEGHHTTTGQFKERFQPSSPSLYRKAHVRSCCPLFWISLAVISKSFQMMEALEARHRQFKWSWLKKKKKSTLRMSDKPLVGKEGCFSFPVSTYREELSSDMKPISSGNSASYTSTSTYTR